MDIVKAFEAKELKTSTGMSINILGTAEDPLFQASQIGELLGLSSILSTIRDFDGDEKGLHTMQTLGGAQTVTVLTELGLYRLLGMSRKPIARTFQKWVATVVREIRLNGKYELERRIQQNEADSQRLLEAKEMETAEAMRKAEAAEEELRRLKEKTYEEVPKCDHVYIMKDASELHSSIHKIGKALDPKKRESQLNTGSARGMSVLYKRATYCAKMVEDMAKLVLTRYHVKYGGGTEHYNCRVEHTVNMINMAAEVVNTMTSCWEYITIEDACDKMIERFRELKARGEWRADENDEEAEEEDEEGEEEEEDKLKTLPHEHRFLKGLVIEKYQELKNGMADRGWISYPCVHLFNKFCEEVKRSNRTYRTTDRRFGRELASVVWSDTRNEGFKGLMKSHSNTGTVYTMDIVVLAQEMVEKSWATRDEVGLDV